jgi:ketosteroid isomerase-like protein
MKILFSLILLMLMSFPLKAQEEHHNHAEMTIKMSVEKILKDYKNALESLDVSNTQHLFSEDATIFENGKFEGSYQDYLDNHISPELGHFKEFTFNDYEVHIRLEGEIAVSFETYTYKIILDGENPRIIERQGTATSVLKNFDGNWKIIQNHGSSREIRN